MFDFIFLGNDGELIADTNGINISQPDSWTLLLTNEAPQSVYQTVLSEIFFVNTADEPGKIERLIRFTIEDDTFNSTAFTFVEIIPTNDPAFFNFTIRELTFNESTREPVSLFSQDDILIDPDETGGVLQWITVEIVSPNDPNDTLLANDQGTGLSISPNGGRLLNISGSGNFTQYEAVLDTVVYFNNFPGMNTTERIINIFTFDGMNVSFVHSITITVIPFDDQAMCYFNMLVSVSNSCPVRLFVTPFLFLVQGTITGTAQYVEEMPPEYIGRSFYLQDFDSDDVTDFAFNVTLTMVQAVDGTENEGLLFSSSGTGVTVYHSVVDPFIIQYTLSGSNSYSEYQQVRHNFFWRQKY